MFKVSYYILTDLIRNRVILGYAGFFSVVGWGTFILESQSEKVLLILLQATLIALPLIALMFATVYYYNSVEFINLILTQPIKRSTVIQSIYISLTATLVMAFIIGMGLPLLLIYPSFESFLLILSGVLLTMLFIALSLHICTFTKDKSRGMGTALLLWVFFAFLYDGLLLLLMYQFGDYPIEKAILVLGLMNPIDTARILVIMKTEASAMMGISGAIFKDSFGGAIGSLVLIISLVFWTFIPFYVARKRFLKKDL